MQGRLWRGQARWACIARLPQATCLSLLSEQDALALAPQPASRTGIWLANPFRRCSLAPFRPQHDLLNVFLGGMLGGSVVYGLRQVIEEPSEHAAPCSGQGA